MYEMTQFVPIPDRDGVWSFDSAKQELRRQRVPGTDQIGDLKVTYDCLPGFG